MSCNFNVVELRTAKNGMAKKISSNCKSKEKNQSCCKEQIVDLGIYQVKKASKTENHLRTLMCSLNQATFFPDMFIETFAVTLGIFSCSKNSLLCILFSLLLLVNLSAGTRQTSSLKLSKLKRGFNKNSLTSASKTSDTKSKLDTELQLSSESLQLSLKSLENSRPVKRQAHLPSSFSSSHNRPQRLITKFGFTVEIRKKGRVRGTRRRSSYSKTNLFIKFKKV